MNADGRRAMSRHAQKAVWAAPLFLASLLVADPAIAIDPITPHCVFDAAPDRELSLEQAVGMALCNNAEVRAAAASAQLRAAELGEARAEYWPTLVTSSSGVQESTRFNAASAPPANDRVIALHGEMSWKLFDFGRRDANSKAASELLEAALATREATAQKVLANVVEAYFDAVTAKALLSSKIEDEQVARETVASTERRMQQGEGAQSDLLQARAALAQATLERNRALAARDKSMAVLTYAVGLSTEARFAIADETDRADAVEDRSLRAWLEEAKQRHPAIVAARDEVAAAESQVLSERSSGRPVVEFQANYYGNGLPAQGVTSTGQRSLTYGITITIPVFDGFLSRYRIQRAEANVAVKQSAWVDTERSTLTQIVKAYSDATAAVANLQESQSLLSAAVALQQSSKRRYESGVADILELVTAQRVLSDARQERVRSLADWRSSRLRLLASAGILADTDVSR